MNPTEGEKAMGGVGRTQVLSVHKFRRAARAREREVQFYLDTEGGGHSSFPWAKGVRVEKAGLFQWAVVLTARRGH